MSSTTKPPHACRLTEDEAEALEAVAEERGEFKSVTMRRAIQFYLNENPDNANVLS